jgi:hypothetical protein
VFQVEDGSAPMLADDVMHGFPETAGWSTACRLRQIRGRSRRRDAPPRTALASGWRRRSSSKVRSSTVSLQEKFGQGRERFCQGQVMRIGARTRQRSSCNGGNRRRSSGGRWGSGEQIGWPGGVFSCGVRGKMERGPGL